MSQMDGGQHMFLASSWDRSSSTSSTMSMGGSPVPKKTLAEETSPDNNFYSAGSRPLQEAGVAERKLFHAHLSLYFPNLPAKPVNGMIKTYSDTSHRTFSRPYSAKTVFFYKDGDEYFTGVRVPISKARYRTINSLMDSLNQNISLPYGVRRLHTPFGRTKIESVEQLKHLGRYVASSTKTLKKVNFESVEEQKRLRHWRPHFSGANTSQTADQPAGSTSQSGEWTANEQGLKVYKARMAANRHMGVAFLPITAKQGLHTAIFKLYSYGGERIVSIEQLVAIKEPRALAVPRNEKPNFSGDEALILPAIGNRLNGKLSRTSSLSRRAPKTKSRCIQRTAEIFSREANGQASSVESNNIERQSKSSKLVPPTNRIPQRSSSLTPGEKAFRPLDSLFRPKQTSKVKLSTQRNGRRLEEIDENLVENLDKKMKLVKKTKNMVSESVTRVAPSTGQHHSLPSSSNTIDSDSGRPRSTDLDDKSSEQQWKYNGSATENGRGGAVQGFFQEEQHKPETQEWPHYDADDISGDDDYPVVSSVVGAAMHAKNKGAENRLVNIDEEEGKLVTDEYEATLENEEVLDKDEVKAAQEESTMQKAQSQGPSAETVEEITPAGEFELLHSGEPEPSPTKAGVLESTPASSAASPAVDTQDNEEQPLKTSESNTSSTKFSKAATRIQKNWRDYTARKKLKKTKFTDELEIIDQEDESEQEEYLDGLNECGPIEGQAPTADDEDINQLLSAGDLDMAMEKRIDSGSEREEVHGTNYLISDMGGMLEPSLSNGMLNKKPVKTFDVFTYSITIITGNRWAADTEADLYLILYGDSAQSERLNLCQEYVNWLQSSEPKFRQNQSDSFQFDVPTRLGVIGRLTVGHEHTGYGAGIFIDRILVTEKSDDEKGRQFLFLCNKWLDSGQVDGKIERSIRLSAFYNITSIPMDNKVTRGRWELIIHSGNASGNGGTTSNLNIVGYGTRGYSKTTEVYDSRMAKVPSESLIQVDFGDIGELLKIRLEVDGSGDSPDYFLNFVELKDLDTEEQFAVMCGKWLRWKSTEKGAQPFRELLAFHVGVEPLPLISYEGKLSLIPHNKIQFSEPEIRLELYGDLGETGFIRIYFDENNNGIGGKLDEKIDVSFKVESVSIGRIYGAKVFFDPTPIGESLYEGFSVLQEIFQKNQVDLPKTTSQWLINHAIIRESTHTPYRYVLSQARLRHRVADEEPYIKELLTTGMEGTSTKISKKKAAKRVESNWILSMAITDNSTLLPVVMLCGDKKTSMQMRNLDPTPTDNIISYQLKSSKIGSLRKIRVTVGTERLNIAPSEGEEVEDFVGIQKIRVCDTANGDELRFPTADVELTRFSVFEFSAIFPDQPPTAIVIYSIRVVTGKSTISGKDFVVRLNLTGETGDIGPRALLLDPDLSEKPSAQRTLFQADSVNSFDLEAVSISEVVSAELIIESNHKQRDFTWECKEIVVTDTNTSMFYVFKFPKLFSVKLTHQTTSVLPFTSAL